MSSKNEIESPPSPLEVFPPFICPNPREKIVAEEVPLEEFIKKDKSQKKKGKTYAHQQCIALEKPVPLHPLTITWSPDQLHFEIKDDVVEHKLWFKFGAVALMCPPPMEKDHPYYDTIVNDPRYAGDPKPDEFPMFESLKLTIERTLPYWNDVIVPQIKEGKRIIIAAHGNSLRGIVKHLDGLSDAAIMELNLPTGIGFLDINEILT